MTPEVSGVGGRGDTFAGGGGGPAEGTGRRNLEMAMDLDISETSPHLQRIWILLLLLSL